jgi:hypothetical protein
MELWKEIWMKDLMRLWNKRIEIIRKGKVKYKLGIIIDEIILQKLNDYFFIMNIYNLSIN